MKYTSAFLWMAVAAFGQITSTTPSAFTGPDPTAIGGKFAARSTGPSPYPKALTITGTGAWHIGTITGTAASAVWCGLAGVQVFDCTLTGAGTTTIYVFFDGTNSNAYTPGDYNAVIPIVNTGVTVNVSLTLTVVARTPPGSITSISGSFAGCSNSSSAYYDLDTCTLTNSRPGGTFNPPALVGNYIDSNFGATVTRIAGVPLTATPRYHPYSQWNPCNANYTRCIVGSTSTVYVINPADGSVLNTGTPCPAVGCAWDAYDPTTYYYLTGKTVHKVVLPAVTDTVLYTYPGTSVDIRNGGSGDTSKDNWWMFWTDATDSKICAINLSNPSQAPCATYSFSPAIGGNDFALVSKGTDAVTNKRYIILNGINYCIMWQFADTDVNLTLFGRFPNHYNALYQSSPSYDTACTDASVIVGGCTPSSHSDTAEVAGIQYVVMGLQTEKPFMQNMVYCKISTGDLMFTPVESGGGATFTIPIAADAIQGDHIGCAKQAPYCVGSKYGSNPITSWKVTNATNATPIVITGDSAYTGANNDILLINNVQGNTNANGLCTVAGLSGASFNCVGSVGNGAYTAATGSFTLNVTVAPLPHVENWVVRGLNTEVRRITPHRSRSFSDTYLGVSGYYDSPRTAILNDGSAVIFDSNYGFPDGHGVFSAVTGFISVPQGGLYVSGNVALTGSIH